MDVILPKLGKDVDGSRIPGSPGWIPVVAYGDGRKLKPVIRCMCGDYLNLKDHHVHADGRVTASFFDKRSEDKGCGWHVFITLAEWDGGEFLPGSGAT